MSGYDMSLQHGRQGQRLFEKILPLFDWLAEVQLIQEDLATHPVYTLQRRYPDLLITRGLNLV